MRVTEASLAERLARMPTSVRDRYLKSLDEEAAQEILGNWRFWARPKQLPPQGDWATWLVMAGRGWGKSKCGSGWMNEEAEKYPGQWFALVAATMADARDVMIEGPSGVLKNSRKQFRPSYEPSKRRITWPNGAWATVFSDEDPDQLRGFSGLRAWLDELGKYKHPRETWENLQFGMRESSVDRPRRLITTTPRPEKILREIIASDTTVTVIGSSYENRSNLDPSWFRDTIEKYEGTRIGRQEIHAEMLDDIPGALWTRRGLDEGRIRVAPPLARIVVGVDPAITSGSSSNETGIVVCGVDEKGHGYVIEDASLRATPDKWARVAVSMLRKYEADCIVAESNQGGQMVEHVLRTIDPMLAIRLVHATRGKYIRAEPIAALYEAGKVSHVGVLAKLEDQMIGFTPELAAVRTSTDSPDRVDACIWALTSLFQAITVRRVEDRDEEHPFRKRYADSDDRNPYTGY